VRVTLPPEQYAAGVGTVTTGVVFTVITFVAAAEHPDPLVTVYEIVVVPPALPVTSPEVLTVAFVGSLEDQTPPAVASVNVIVFPEQTALAPLIAATVGIVLIVAVTAVLVAETHPVAELRACA
jgi:hypothetical protein